MDTQTFEKLQRIYDQADSFGKSLMEKEFPELKESENERIRKELISFITDRKNWFPKEETKSSWIAWLEKQVKVFKWKHWSNGIAGNSEGKQTFLIKQSGIYSISSCLGCECDYIELSELDKILS